MDDHMRMSICEAITHGIVPRSSDPEVTVEIFVDDFLGHLADCGYQVVPEGSDQ